MAKKPSPKAQPVTGISQPGSTLPFKKTPTASVAEPTIAASSHQWRKQESHLRKDAPNVLIIMLDDVGFAHANTVGGAIHTPTLSRIADTGTRYNAFHTTAISSATRASLLTGRNHHRVESGTITEFASDFDGYTGEIPKTSATIPEVLKHYLHYEYNALGLARTKLRSSKRITKGPHRFDLDTVRNGDKPGAPATFVMRVDGMEVARGTTPFTPPLCFTASESFDVGCNLGTPVSMDYADRAPFNFNGAISDVHIVYTK